MSRFDSISEKDLDTLDGQKDSKYTKRVLKRSVSRFREFLGENCEFEVFSSDDLNKSLQAFFASIQKTDGTDLKISSLTSIKYGLCKYLKDECSIDVYNDKSFSSCLKTFKSKLTDLKKKGKGSIDHKKEISHDDLQKLFSSDNIAFNIETPCGLQKKVWFEIMYFLCRRGQENLREMKKDTFSVAVNATGRRYVYQMMDEADKNHGGQSSCDKTIGEGKIYELPGDVNCPVVAFEKYISKLHPRIDCLWQRPLDSFDTDGAVWYCMVPLGMKKLFGMMADISNMAHLSKRYTNHCIRATSICELDRNGIEARHLVRTTGNKSEMSIRSYSKRLCDEKQQQISDTLANVLKKKPKVLSEQVPIKQHISIVAFKNSPKSTNTESCFYNMICSSVNVAQLHHHVGVKKGETQKIDYQFSINQILSGIMWAARERVVDCDRFRVIVRMCAMKEGCKTPQEDEIPDCIIFVNSKIALIQTDNKHRGSLDITDNCKFNKNAPSYNTLRIELRHNVKHYCVTVSVVEMLDTEGVLSKMMQMNIRPPETIIKDILKSDTDVSYTSFRTQLTCPLGKSRMVTPCRGSYCTHFYCMDALTLLKLNETRPLSKKKCFMCDKPLEFIYVDGLFLNILQGVPETVNEVKFEKDGCWSYTKHINNEPDDAKPVCCETSDHKLPLENMNDFTDIQTSNDSIDDSPLLTAQLEKIKLQLDKLSNLTTTPIKDEFIHEDTLTVDDKVDVSNNFVEIVSDAVGLTERPNSVYMDKDDKTGILEVEQELKNDEFMDKDDKTGILEEEQELKNDEFMDKDDKTGILEEEQELKNDEFMDKDNKTGILEEEQELKNDEFMDKDDKTGILEEEQELKNDEFMDKDNKTGILEEEQELKNDEFMDKDDKTGILEEEQELKNDELSMDDKAYGNMVELEISRLLNKSKPTELSESVERTNSKRKHRSIKSDNKEASNKAGWSKCGHKFTKIIPNDKKKAPNIKKEKMMVIIEGLSSSSKVTDLPHESITQGQSGQRSSNFK